MEPIHKLVKVTATVTATARVVEYEDGSMELDELEEVLEVEDFDKISDLD